MSETSTSAPHQPGVYVKGDVVRTATTPAKAVALVFNGFVRQAPVPPSEDADYRDLQAQAKELDIPANQSADVLREAIFDAKLADSLRDSNTLETKSKPVPTPPKN